MMIKLSRLYTQISQQFNCRFSVAIYTPNNKDISTGLTEYIAVGFCSIENRS